MTHIIDKPGNYDLSTFMIEGKENSFIISSDDVILRGEINQNDVSRKNVVAITIQKGIKNVKIQNSEIQTFSGGGVWCLGENKNILLENVKFVNCAYFGNDFSQTVLIDTGCENIRIVNCTFSENGIYKGSPLKYASSCGAIVAYNSSDILFEGCTIDGCIGYEKSWAIVLGNISNILLKDIFITDVFSTKDARELCVDNVDGKIEDLQKASIISNLRPFQYCYFLENHYNDKEDVDINSDYDIEVSHFQKIIPGYEEMEENLYQEHKWRDFRTMNRLVCHNSHVKSRTSTIYAKWVELFCERVLKVKVKVESGFANLYLNGKTSLPKHRDQYKKWIIGLSFGETRTLDFLPDNREKEIVSYPMGAGDVLIFSHEVNNRYQHRMLEEEEKEGRRINITYFVEIYPGQDENNLLKRPSNLENIPTFEEAENLI